MESAEWARRATGHRPAVTAVIAVRTCASASVTALLMLVLCASIAKLGTIPPNRSWISY